MLGRANARAIKRGVLSASIDDNFRWPASSIRQRQSRRFPPAEQDPTRSSTGNRSFFSFVAARKRVTEATFTRCLSSCQAIHVEANDVGHKHTSAFVEFSTSNSLIEAKGFRTRWENSARRSPLDRARHPRVREPFGYKQTFTATLSRIVWRSIKQLSGRYRSSSSASQRTSRATFADKILNSVGEDELDLRSSDELRRTVPVSGRE